MIIFVRFFLLLLMGFAFLGCASQSRVIVMNPEIKPYKSVEGNQKPVTVLIAEKRVFSSEEEINDKEAGRFHIMTDDNTLSSIYLRVSDSLEDRGFRVMASDQTQALQNPMPELSIDIVEMQYLRRKGFWHGVNEFKVTLDVVLRDDNNITYQKRYRSRYENHVDQKPSADSRTRYANRALSGALDELFGDSALLARLTVD